MLVCVCIHVCPSVHPGAQDKTPFPTFGIQGMNNGDNLGPRGLSSLNKTGWEALNKSRANSEQLTVVNSSPTDIYRNVTG